MAWDDELEQLTTKADETFGWGTFQAALARALAATITHKMEPDPGGSRIEPACGVDG